MGDTYRGYAEMQFEPLTFVHEMSPAEEAAEDRQLLEQLRNVQPGDTVTYRGDTYVVKSAGPFGSKPELDMWGVQTEDGGEFVCAGDSLQRYALSSFKEVA